MKINKWLVAGLGIAISVVFLWLAFRNLDPELVLQHIQEVNLLWVLVSTAVFFAAVVVIALRWGFLLRSVGDLSLRDLFQLVCIGYMGNNVYPFRSGEVLRIFLLGRQHNVPVAKVTMTVVLERVFDGIVLLTFVLVGTLAAGITSPEIQSILSVATPIFGIALAVFFVLAARPDLLRGLYRLVERLLPEALRKPIAGIVEGLIGGLEGLRSPADLAGAVVSSYATWGLQAVVFWLVLLAFGMEVSSPLAVMLLAVGVVNLAGLLPASPGQAGVFEFFVGLVLTAAGADSAQATAYALVLHVVIWLPVTLLGFYFLVKQGLGWSAITRAHTMEGEAVS